MKPSVGGNDTGGWEMLKETTIAMICNLGRQLANKAANGLTTSIACSGMLVLNNNNNHNNNNNSNNIQHLLGADSMPDKVLSDLHGSNFYP